MSITCSAHTRPRSLVWATDLDVLPFDRVLERRERYLVVRSPGNPGHYWGNLLLFDDPPVAGDGARWERLFELEFAGQPLVRHRTFAWDRLDGVAGRAREEFIPLGYELEERVGLVADGDRIRPHRRENRDVQVRSLEPAAGVDEQLWAEVVELQVASREQAEEEAAERAFSRRRLEDLRDLFRAGRGAWYVALDPGETRVLGSCGVVVTDRDGRFQAVDTALGHRRQGICSRLVVEAARLAARQHDARRLVIAADPAYHALGLYQSLGFRVAERVLGVCRHPRLLQPA